MPEKEIEESNIDEVIMEMLTETRVNIINSNQGVSKDYAFLKIKQVINSDYVLKSAVGEAIEKLAATDYCADLIDCNDNCKECQLNHFKSELKKAVEGL